METFHFPTLNLILEGQIFSPENLSQASISTKKRWSLMARLKVQSTGHALALCVRRTEAQTWLRLLERTEALSGCGASIRLGFALAEIWFRHCANWPSGFWVRDL
ncbi:hypothetical protein V6Z11_A09G067000 [Gossypium hirsutum]